MKSDKKIITISRGYGTYGHEVGRILAEKLGYAFYDRQLITIAARESGYTEDIVENSENVSTNPLGFVMNKRIALRQYGMNMNDRLYNIQYGIIRTIADRENAVIIGRCADHILKDYAKTMNFFIDADMDYRVAVAMDLQGLDEKEAIQFVQKMDKYRSTYYNYYTEMEWGARENYDLCINRTGISDEDAADLIYSYLKLRGWFVED